MTTTYVIHTDMDSKKQREGMFARFDNSLWGTRKRAEDRLASARPKKRPASATNRDSRRSVGVATAARCMRDGVTGSACTDRLHPSGHLACGTSDAGHRWRRVIPHITLPQLWDGRP